MGVRIRDVQVAALVAFVAVCAPLLVIAAVATLTPAWCAARIDPLLALRAE